MSSNFETLIGKVMSDENFAKQLQTEPERALKGIGIEPTPEILNALRGVDPASIQRVPTAFGDRRAAM